MQAGFTTAHTESRRGSADRSAPRLALEGEHSTRSAKSTRAALTGRRLQTGFPAVLSNGLSKRLPIEKGFKMDLKFKFKFKIKALQRTFDRLILLG